MQLQEGQKAPSFKGKNQNNEEIALEDFKGSKVVLYFYPKDNTPGCTKESCNLRDNYDQLIKSGYKVIGVSNDGVESHKKFADKYNLPFDLIADTDKKITKDYGVFGEKKSFGNVVQGIKRTTFVIDESGNIEKIIKKVDTKDHTAQII
jgi:thioredoxin-dependent peroxiredoxin